ncbi:MAG: hypothetical protein IPN15_14360 [Saprospiraceae bacterium]|nr:hypothetical protein [Candidatus Vicinibacter affinis]
MSRQQQANKHSSTDEFNTMLYIVNGTVIISGYGLVEAEKLVVFDQSPGEVEIFSKTASQYILLSGAPLHEKVVQQGPFVMNSKQKFCLPCGTTKWVKWDCS